MQKNRNKKKFNIKLIERTIVSGMGMNVCEAKIGDRSHSFLEEGIEYIEKENREYSGAYINLLAYLIEKGSNRGCCLEGQRNDTTSKIRRVGIPLIPKTRIC